MSMEGLMSEEIKLTSETIELLHKRVSVRKYSDEPVPQEMIDAVLSCLLYTSPSPRDVEESRMPSSA